MKTSIEQNQLISVNGVLMTIKEYKASKATPKKKSSKKTQKYNSVSMVKDEISPMFCDLDVLKSLTAYYRHGYKQWGTIASEMMALNKIRRPLLTSVLKTKEIEEIMGIINDMSKRSEKNVFAYVEKLSWKVDDLRTALNELTDGISSSGVISRFGNHEMISGSKDGKRLGLKTLTRRAWKATIKMEKLIRELQNIATNGVDAFEYTLSGKRQF